MKTKTRKHLPKVIGFPWGKARPSPREKNIEIIRLLQRGRHGRARRVWARLMGMAPRLRDKL